MQVVWALLQCFLMFFVPSQVYSRDRCHFSLVFQKIYKGTPFVRTRDLSDYSRMLYPELYPRCIQIQKYHCKHAQVVWALLQCFLFRVKCTLAIDVIFLLSQKFYKGTPGSKQGPLGLQPNALPLSYIPAAYRFNNITANTCRLFEHCYNGFLFRVKCTLAIDVVFLYSFKNYTRGHPGSNQGPLGLQPIALPLSSIPAAYRFNNITPNTSRLFEHCYKVFCSQ